MILSRFLLATSCCSFSLAFSGVPTHAPLLTTSRVTLANIRGCQVPDIVESRAVLRTPALSSLPSEAQPAKASSPSPSAQHVEVIDGVEYDAEDAQFMACLAMAMLGCGAVLHAAPAHAASAATAIAAASSTAAPVTSSQILEKAFKRALGGGVSGAFAGVMQVLLLMWLRTTMNYQYRNGGGTRDALQALYTEGGLPRFYRGVSFALVQTPLSRFGDTAANSGVLALLAASDLPVGVRTAIASAAASVWRIGLTPLDTVKTTLQVQGADGYAQVMAKVEREGAAVLFQGALANAAASFVGNYPWYLVFNSLNEALPLAPAEDLPLKLCRSALLGISAACVSDTVSNSIRVLKTTRQTSAETIGYREAIERIVEQDGWAGLFGRGLGTRLVTNALQASLFTVVWKLGEDALQKGGLF